MSTGGAGSFSDAMTPWFIRGASLVAVLDRSEADEMVHELSRAVGFKEPERSWMRERVLVDGTRRVLDAGKVTSLGIALLRGEVPEPGQLVHLEQAFYFRGLSAAKTARQQGKAARATFHARVATDQDWTVKGTFSPDHLMNATAESELSGRSRVFMLATINSVAPNDIDLRPIVFARRTLAGPLTDSEWQADLHGLQVFPSDIQEFAKMVPSDAPGWKESVMRQHAESTVKQWFAEIIGEPFVFKDWGGELCDFVTPRLHVKSHQVRTAFLLKGPARFSPMKLTHLGKNGDQLFRLFKEPAQLYILQHCHYVTAAVVHMMGMYAETSKPRAHFCIIDGHDTWRILRGYGKV